MGKEGRGNVLIKRTEGDEGIVQQLGDVDGSDLVFLDFFLIFLAGGDNIKKRDHALAVCAEKRGFLLL